MKQNRRPKYESTQLHPPDFSQSHEKQDGEKTASSANVAGKIRYLHVGI
jgi:hypothetical protein